jgi:hypothetical protein
MSKRNRIDIKDKTAATNWCFHALNKTVSKKYISKSIKIRTYRTVTLNSSETWTSQGKWHPL